MTTNGRTKWFWIRDTIGTQDTLKSYVSYQCSQFKTHKNDTKDNFPEHPLMFI